MIENISLPQEVEEAMDRRTSMGVVGDLNKYTQFQAAESMREAANNQGGTAGMGAGMGAGMMMAQTMQMASHMSQQSAAPAVSGETKFCPECGQKIPRTAKFCPECGKKQ